MRAVTLSATQAGMTRLRDKGGASPTSLYELTNGYVDASRAPRQRPGTTWQFTFPADTKGLCVHRGKFRTFAATPMAGTDDYVVHCLRHPDAAFTGTLAAIHYAQPFLGNLYVVAEFEDGLIAHYYLKDPPTWLPNNGYLLTDMVQPTVPNGYYYQATIGVQPVAWAPRKPRAQGDVVQPTVTTGWKYTVTATTGDAPVSGATEPEWPQTEGATVTEYGDIPPPEPPASPPAPPVDPGGYGGGPGASPKPYQPWKPPLYETVPK